MVAAGESETMEMYEEWSKKVTYTKVGFTILKSDSSSFKYVHINIIYLPLFWHF